MIALNRTLRLFCKALLKDQIKAAARAKAAAHVINYLSSLEPLNYVDGNNFKGLRPPGPPVLDDRSLPLSGNIIR
jgi:hypothetical protein